MSYVAYIAAPNLDTAFMLPKRVEKRNDINAMLKEKKELADLSVSTCAFRL